MIDLIREWLELWAKQNWLKHINREIDKYNRLKQDAISSIEDALDAVRGLEG